MISISPVMNGPVSAQQQDVERHRARDRADVPAERPLQRHDHHAGRRAHAHRASVTVNATTSATQA